MRMCPHRIGEQVDFATADDPNGIWPQTTWQQVQGSFALASSSGHALGSTGGAETHTHGMGSHTHHLSTNKVSAGARGYSTELYLATSGYGKSLWTMGDVWARTTAGDYHATTDLGYGGIAVEGTSDGPSTNTTGGGSSLPPFVAVNRWKRVA